MLFNVCALYIKIMNNENQTIHKFDFNLNWYGWNDKLSQLNADAMHQVVVALLANKRQGTQSAKTRINI